MPPQSSSLIAKPWALSAGGISQNSPVPPSHLFFFANFHQPLRRHPPHPDPASEELVLWGTIFLCLLINLLPTTCSWHLPCKTPELGDKWRHPKNLRMRWTLSALSPPVCHQGQVWRRCCPHFLLPKGPLEKAASRDCWLDISLSHPPAPSSPVLAQRVINRILGHLGGGTDP